jgi:hypothetical protein
MRDLAHRDLLLGCSSRRASLTQGADAAIAARMAFRELVIEPDAQR